MVHQELNQALKRNVMDNIWLGRYPMTAGIMVNEHKMLEDTNKIFEELGIAVDPKRITKADGRDRESGILQQ